MNRFTCQRNLVCLLFLHNMFYLDSVSPIIKIKVMNGYFLDGLAHYHAVALCDTITVIFNGLKSI